MREVNSSKRTKLWGEFGFFFSLLLLVNLAQARSEGEIASTENKNNSKFFLPFSRTVKCVCVGGQRQKDIDGEMGIFLLSCCYVRREKRLKRL